MSKNDGGPAFPRPVGFVPNTGAAYNKSEVGITYRQWLVGKALQGQAANLSCERVFSGTMAEMIAVRAVWLADAAIAEEAKG